MLDSPDESLTEPVEQGHDQIEVLPKSVRDIGWKGQLRMCRRYRHLMAASKPKVVATTAIARAMVGFIWAIARVVTPAPGGEARAQG